MRGAADEVEALVYDALEFGGVGDEVVGGGYYDYGVGEVASDFPGDVGDAWGSVAHAGFEEDVVGGYLW